MSLSLSLSLSLKWIDKILKEHSLKFYIMEGKELSAMITCLYFVIIIDSGFDIRAYNAEAGMCTSKCENSCAISRIKGYIFNVTLSADIQAEK